MIGFAGLSHLGIVSSIAAAAKGFDVLGYDPDPALCTQLSSGQFPVHEPGLAETFAACRARIRFTPDQRELRECDVAYLSIDVPTDRDNRSNVHLVNDRLRQLAANSAPGTTLVLLSQAPPGFTRRWADRLQAGSDSRDLLLFYQVETLIFGRAVERALRPERIIVGCAEPQRPLPPGYTELLSAFGCPILPMRYESAELAKIAINFYLVSSVSVTNTLAGLCERLGANWAEIVPTLRLDPRIGPNAYLSPGLGLSGGNLERDLATVQTLADEYGTEAGIVDAWLANSRHRREWVLRRLHAEVLSRCEDATIALWGLAYKPDTASLKNSPAVTLIDALEGVAVRAYDPQAALAGQHPDFRQLVSPLDACAGADALAVLTPWPEFRIIEPASIRQRMRGRTLIDPFAALDGDDCRRAGFDYFRLGEPAEKRTRIFSSAATG
jgi:UDPglucose 6-dehydrogenase